MKIFKRIDLNPINMNLYLEAFTHTSYTNENPSYTSYERLEFLGDAILEFIVSEYLYKERNLEEGIMTRMRASYVCEKALSTYAKELKFSEDIRLGGCENTPNDTILADVFEAFVAALYLDQGMDYTRKFVLNVIAKYIDKNIDFLQDYKSKLQELVQTDKQSVTYEVIKEEGPSHNKLFTVEVKVDDIVMATGVGSSKKSAEQEAAKNALDKQAK